jgi:dihydrofolate synthase / folylpolyglutamate synthase
MLHLLVLLFAMTYKEFLEYIYQRYSGNVKLGLERITGILEDMGNPQNALRGIHIGGTNGKGSTCAALESLLLAHGLQVGLNTSPHLIDYCERFRVDGKNADFAEILDVFHRFEQIFSRWDASFFEITTAIAFQYFVEHRVEAAVIEVGLGGRLDATNLFTPEVSAITTIGLDHTKTLGGTLELIAFEKAGIIKPGVPVVLGRIDDSPRQVILDKATGENSPAYVLNREYFVSNLSNRADGLCFDYSFEDTRLTGLQTNLLGSHQAANLSLALTAFLLYCRKTGLHADENKIRTALQNIHWMGRMQLLRTQPLVIVDGAHNLQGVEALTANLRELFPGRKLLIVASILADKDYEQMLKALCPYAGMFYISKNTSDRAAEIEVQAEVVHNMGIGFRTAPTVQEAYQLALRDAGPDDVIIGAGSLYTVAEIISSV